MTVYANDLDLPQPSRYFYVYDEANIIDSSLESYIINSSETLYQYTGAQIVVAVVSSLQDSNEQEFANKLFEKWGIGDRDKDNGVLMLIAPNEKRLWIEVGYGLEGALPDGRVGEIRDKDIFPYFQTGEYSKGILNGFDSILSIIKDEYGVEFNSDSGQEYPSEANNGNNENGLFGSIRNILVAIGVVIFLIIDFTFFRGFLTMMILRSVMRGGGRGGGGGGNRGGGGSSGGGGAGGGW